MLYQMFSSFKIEKTYISKKDPDLVRYGLFGSLGFDFFRTGSGLGKNGTGSATLHCLKTFLSLSSCNTQFAH